MFENTSVQRGRLGRSSCLLLLLSVVPLPALGQGCLAPPSGMIGWWPGDGDTQDMIAGRDGTFVNGSAFATGKVGQAFLFDGLNYVSVPDDPIWTLGTNPFTIDLWVMFTGTPSINPLIAHDEGSGQLNKWIFSWGTLAHREPIGQGLRFHINGPTGPLDPVASLRTITTDTWYHVAVTRSGSTYSLYIDGLPVITESDSNPIQDPAASLTIGKAESFNLTGLIDEVELFNRALSSDEISAIYNAGSAGKCKMRVAIDIKPGSDPNCFNQNGHGLIPVAILGSPDLDVMQINTSSLIFNGLQVRVRGNDKPQCAVESVDADGIPDMVCQFVDDSSLWNPGNAMATLTGSLVDGTTFYGTDSICIVPPQ